MKQLVMCLVAVAIVVVVWAAGSREATARSPVPAAELGPAPAAPGLGFGACAPGSQGTCSGQILGTQCGTNPTRFCLPLTTPGAGGICSCR
ncbi:MAG TPA: hypothetical protein VHW23_16900 [Kofleriaceae bacterium]|jgi:hypothetical protein|nr:hypothetical protein [Kofleriaceae bacterium]